jgi:hypothetical protein
MIQLIMLLMTIASGETLQQHKQQMQSVANQMVEYEVRLEELKEKKTKTPDGPELEEILSEIADIHKELVAMKQKREKIRTHVRKEHPQQDIFSDLSFYKQNEKSKEKDEKGDALLDKKLDELLKLVQSQYVRTLSEDFKISQDLQTEEDVRKKLKEQRAKVRKADKKKYISEEVQTTIKAE